jgi:hypothetical protein
MTNDKNHAFPEAGRLRWVRTVGIVAFGIAGLLQLAKTVNAQGVQTQPLSLIQIQKLIRVQAPDSTIAAEIRRRGLGFVASKEISEALRRAGAGAETLQAIDELRPMLDEARQAIPPILARIYQSLDQGNPQAIRPFVSPQIAGDAARLDAISRPFAYRAHYIEAVIERPGQRFEVRVHALFKPLVEKAQVLTFHPSRGTFLLMDIADPGDDWFGPAKEAAIQIARNFIYAAKAQRAEVLAGLVVPGLDVSRYLSEPCWRDKFQLVIEVRDVRAQLEDHQGLKIAVHAQVAVKAAAGMTTEESGDFWIDRVDDQYKIVSVRPLHDTFFYYVPPQSCRRMDDTFYAAVEAPHLADDTLARFGLSKAE